MSIPIGIFCPSEIALRRFMPALAKCPEFRFSGISYASDEEWFGSGLPSVPEEVRIRRSATERAKAEAFLGNGGELFDSYAALASAEKIDAVYLPLPPGLHAKWGQVALENGKHLLIEKPATTRLADTRKLVETARNNRLALHENYMFALHDQLAAIDRIVAGGEIGELRLIRISFGFPRRAANDFRYNRILGGGALLDCGGYTIKYASMLLGESARLTAATTNRTDEFEVDLYGSATMVNESGVTAQLAFGMDNDYKCELELWGSRGCLFTGRILTAPVGFVPTAVIHKGSEEQIRELPSDDTFTKSIRHFKECIGNPAVREGTYRRILRQAELVEEFRNLSGMKEI